MPTKISIVTPSFNQALFVEETLRSVLTQDYPNLEYVVIDGASTDGSPAIIEKYRSQLAYYVSEPDKGHGEALNKGFARTSGEIMAWLNSDDKYCPWTLRTVAEIFDAFPSVEWITGLHGTWNDRGTLMSAAYGFRNIHDYVAGRYEWIQQETSFWRRSLWEKAGGRIDESYRFMVDGELWTRFFQHAEPAHALRALGGYRRHPANRAGLHMQECHQEMQRAIAAMRERLIPEQIAPVPRPYLALDFDYQRNCWVLGRFKA